MIAIGPNFDPETNKTHPYTIILYNSTTSDGRILWSGNVSSYNIKMIMEQCQMALWQREPDKHGRPPKERDAFIDALSKLDDTSPV